MAKISKQRKAAEALLENNKFYTIDEASALIKQVNCTKFDSSVDVHIKLGVDPKKADQALRGTATLPHGTGKTKTVLVLCTPDKEQEAKDAGADYVGLDEFVIMVDPRRAPAWSKTPRRSYRRPRPAVSFPTRCDCSCDRPSRRC